MATRNHPRGGYLSATFFHPDCPHCGADGSILVTKRHGDPSTEWTCVACRGEFDTPRESEWFGVRQLPDKQEDAFVALEIVGVPRKYYTKSRGLKVAGAKSRLKRAKESLREIRESDVDPVPRPPAVGGSRAEGQRG